MEQMIMKTNPSVKLMDASPLWIAIHAIRKCWKSEGESDSHFVRTTHLQTAEFSTLYGINLYDLAKKTNAPFVLGVRDRDLLRRVIKHGHESTIEHLKYTFEIKDMSRACLQELARHRIASLSVESSRYCLNRMIKSASIEVLCALIVSSGDSELDSLNVEHMMRVAELGKRKGLKNDVLKYGMVEAFATELDWTINARSLRNFIRLRSSKRALKEIRALAQVVYDAIPEDHLPIYEDISHSMNGHGPLVTHWQGGTVIPRSLDGMTGPLDPTVTQQAGGSAA